MSTISESGTNQPTGSEPQTTGTSNDSATAAIVRAESFLQSLLGKLETWLHIGDVASAKADAENALHHLAEGKALAQGEQPSGAVAAAGLQAAPVADQVAEGEVSEKAAGDAESTAQQ